MSTDSRSDIFAAFHRVAVVASSNSSYRPRNANISIQNGVQGPLGSLYFAIVRVSSVVLPYRSIIHRLFSKSAKERARREEKRLVKGERSLESFFSREQATGTRSNTHGRWCILVCSWQTDRSQGCKTRFKNEFYRIAIVKARKGSETNGFSTIYSETLRVVKYIYELTSLWINCE